MNPNRILIVTSNVRLAQDLQKQLEQLGLRVIGLANSEEETYIKIKDLKPDLILIDIHLSYSQNDNRAWESIYTTLNIPVVHITRGGDRETLQHTKHPIPSGIVVIPVDKWQLLGTIEMALIRHQLEDQLRESRKWLNTTLVSIGEGVIATDAEGRVQFINPTAQKVVEWTQTDALGMPFQKIFTLADDPNLANSDLDGIQKTTGLRIGKDFEGSLISKSGRRLPVGVNATLINDDRNRSLGTVLVFRDLTKQKEAIQEIQRQAHRAEALAQAASQLNKQLDLEKVLNTICVITNDVLNASATAVFLRDPAKDFFKSMATYGDLPNLQRHAGNTYKIPAQILEDLLSLERPTLVITDPQNHPDWPYLDLIQAEGTHTLVMTVLSRGDQMVGAMLSVIPGSQYTLGAEDKTLLHGLADQASSAIENASLFEQVRTGRERQRKLAKSLVNIQEAERQTIARDLHDHLGQTLTGLQFMLEGVKTHLPQEQKAEVGEIQKVVSMVIEQVREMSLNLRPSMLDDMGLIPTLQWHFRRYTMQTGIQVNFQHDQFEERIPAEIATAAYRIVQEALTNVARYAQTQDVFVGLARHNDSLWLEIMDKGRGFDATTVSDRPSTGLGGMRERASLVGGYLFVESYLDQGTQVVAALPLSIKPIERRKHDRKNTAD